MFENLSLGHLLVVVVIFVLLFGPKRIPEIAASLGGGIRTFKQSLQDGMQDGASESVSPRTDAAALRAGASEAAPRSLTNEPVRADEGPKRLL